MKPYGVKRKYDDWDTKNNGTRKSARRHRKNKKTQHRSERRENPCS